MPSPYETLYNELAFALLAGKPETQIATPGFPWSTRSAEYVVSDRMAGEGECRGNFAALLRIVAQVAAGKPAQVAAQAWIDEQAAVHASFHADDLAHQMAEEEDGEPSDRFEREALGLAA